MTQSPAEGLLKNKCQVCKCDVEAGRILCGRDFCRNEFFRRRAKVQKTEEYRRYVREYDAYYDRLCYTEGLVDKDY